MTDHEAFVALVAQDEVPGALWATRDFGGHSRLDATFPDGAQLSMRRPGFHHPDKIRTEARNLAFRWIEMCKVPDSQTGS